MWLRSLVALGAAVSLWGCAPTGRDDKKATNSVPAVSTDHLKLPATGNITRENLVAFAHAKMAHRPADQFSKAFDDSALEGRTFELRLPIARDETSANFSYDAEKEQLTLSLLPEAASLHRDEDTYGPDFHYLTISNEQRYGDPTPMANAYGVTKAVTPVFTIRIGVGSLEGEYMGAAPVTKIGDIRLYDLATKTLAMAPDQARSATAGLTMTIRGVVRKPASGHIVECYESSKKATLSYNYEEHWKQCVISSTITSIEVVSPSAGVLASWPAKRQQKN